MGSGFARTKRAFVWALMVFVTGGLVALAMAVMSWAPLWVLPAATCLAWLATCVYLDWRDQR